MINRNNYLLVKEFLKVKADNSGTKAVSFERYYFYLKHLLEWADEIPFAQVSTIKPPLYAYIKDLPGKNGVGKISNESIKKIVNLTKALLKWAKEEYEQEFLTLPKKWFDQIEPVKTPIKEVLSDHEYVTYDEILQIASMEIPADDLCMLRDQAAACLSYLGGLRAGAFTSLPIKALDPVLWTVQQFPELGVLTKNSKRAQTYLFKIEELLIPIKKWDAIVRTSLPKQALWYAPINQSWGGNQTLVSSNSSKNGAVHFDKQLHKLFDYAGLDYKSSHKFRHGFAVYGITHCRNMAEYQAISRNLMHSSIEITDKIYAGVKVEELRQFFDQIVKNPIFTPDDELSAYLSHLAKGDLVRAITIAANLMATS